MKSNSWLSVIARKDGEQVRLWARTTSDYSNAFNALREAVNNRCKSASLRF
jgi:hypothetical protein